MPEYYSKAKVRHSINSARDSWSCCLQAFILLQSVLTGQTSMMLASNCNHALGNSACAGAWKGQEAFSLSLSQMPFGQRARIN